MKSFSNTAAHSVALGLFLGAALPSCSRPAQAHESRPIPVKVELAERRTGSTESRYSGSLEPETRVELAFRVSGYVASLAEVPAANGGTRPIDKGDFVKKGTVLARIRSADYVQKLKTAEAQVGEARAQQILAAEELARAQRLFAGGAITKAELDTKRAKADSARAQVEGATAQSGEAALSVGDTALRAPIDGVVLSRQVEVGSLVAPGQAAISIADTRTMKAVFGAPQVLVEKIHVGSPVTVFVGAESESRTPEKLLSARVTRVAPAADSNGRVFSVEAALPNQHGELRAGAVVSVRVLDQSLDSTSVLVPLRAVLRSPRNPQGYAVFVLEGEADRGRVRLRDVRLGEVVGNGVMVAEGIARSQRVVTVGGTLLRDGDDAVVIR